jgi:hypothetical protein
MLIVLGVPLSAADPTLEVQLNGQRLEGKALAWSAAEVLFLARDGQMHRFPPSAAKQARKLSSAFRCYSPNEMRGMLKAEFGQAFEVTGTGHYLVVHPAGQRDQWAQRFEELYRSFVHYFQVRSWRVPESRFPLVAVVFPTKVQYMEYARRTGSAVSADTLGYYSPVSNRILMYDTESVRGGSEKMNMETILHEAAHQTAFNTGIHDRQYSPPRWVCEGLGTLFEAPGVFAPREHPRQSDRLNVYRLERFATYLKRRQSRGALAEFIATDRLFESDTDAAYAEAWALSFFLAETRPKQYVQYLQRTAGADGKPPGATDGERLQDFAGVFGNNLTLLETHYLRFMSQWTK